jgi:hypothetical protein
MTGKASRQRHRQGSVDHLFRDVDARWKPRAAFGTEGEAHAAANRVFGLTGRRYSAYRCSRATCDAWHIRPCPLRPADLARSA